MLLTRLPFTLQAVGTTDVLNQKTSISFLSLPRTGSVQCTHPHMQILTSKIESLQGILGQQIPPALNTETKFLGEKGTPLLFLLYRNIIILVNCKEMN